jgi:recombination protein RecT
MADMTPHQKVVADFREAMEVKFRPEIAKMMPPGLDDEKGLDRFIRTVITAVQRNEDLLYADRKSLMFSCMRAAQDGLLPDGKESVLNVYKTKVKVWSEQYQREVENWIDMVQFLPMVRGIIKLLYATGCVAHIDAAAVYERDHFRFLRGDDARIEHEPYTGADDPGPLKAAYVIIKLTNGEVHREVMFKRDIDKVRDCAKTQSVWSKWPDQMAIKAVIKRAAKLLPSDSEALERVIAHDNEAMGFIEREPAADTAPALATSDTEPTAPPPAAPALADAREEQAARRPSRMAGILRQHAPAKPVGGPDDIPAWEEIPPEFRR